METMMDRMMGGMGWGMGVTRFWSFSCSCSPSRRSSNICSRAGESAGGIR